MTIAFRRTLFAAFLTLLAVASLPAQNTTQQLALAGLRTVGMQGQWNAIKTDAAGNAYLLLDQKDGVRVFKTDNAGTRILAQALLGASGDVGTALALDLAGNVYVAGTTTSATLTATAGAAITTRTDASTNSFVARFDSNLNPIFVTFTGGSKIAATALAVTADAVFVTGVTYAANLPVTPNGIQQSPAPGSFGNGFVERFSASGATLVYATYLTGASGDTTPAALVADSADDAYIAGSTSASGYPTVTALVPNALSSPSGFLTKLTPAGDAITASTFLPGPGLTSLALNGAGTGLLVSGSIALGQFPVDQVATPVAPVGYQVLVRMPLNLQSVTHATLLAPGTQSFVATAPNDSVWVDGALGLPLLSLTPLANIGSIFAVRVTAAGAIDQTARFGGVPNGNPTFASLSGTATSIAVDPAGQPFVAGSVQPTASSALLATETYDLPLRNVPTALLPASLAAAAQTAATCNGSLCAGSAAYLARLNPNASAPALSFSPGDLPFIILRNLGSTDATALTVTATGSTVATNCTATLPAGGECNILLRNGQGGTLTATAAGGDSQTLDISTYPAATPASSIVFTPKELDFGIQTTTSPAGQRTFTVTNLGATSQTFTSALDAVAAPNQPFTEAASDCVLAGAANRKLLAPGGTCHITLAFTATAASSGPQQANWSVGGKDILLTGFSQTGSLSVSSTQIDFGTRFAGGLRLPRYLYLSNPSTTPATHAALHLAASSPFTLSDSCPSTLPAGTVCRIRIDYNSPVTANDSTTITLDDGLSVLLTGSTQPARGTTGATVNPNLSITPTAILFPDATVVTGVSSNSQTVSVTNAGTAPFTLNLALSGDFTDVTSCGTTLAGGATCAITLSFAPAQPGTRTGLLAITAGAGTSPAYVTLTGTGNPILPAANGLVDLGSTPINQPVTQYLKIAQSFSTLTVTTTGAFTAGLIEDTGFGPGNPPASAFSTSLSAPCRNCFLAVRFTPTVTGFQTGTLTLTSASGGSPFLLALTGAGTASTGLLLTPAVQDFGAIPLNSSSGTTLFTLTNQSASPVVLSAPALTGDFIFPMNQANPTGSQACTGTLAPGATCATLVTFAPTALGTRTGTLTVGTATAALTGTGAADPGLAINPLALTFANVPGQPATRQTITLTNTSVAPLTISALTTTPGFTASSNCLSLAPATSCTVTVTFTPGAATASGNVAFVAGGQKYQVALTGTYTASSAGIQIVPNLGNFGATPIGTTGSVRVFSVNNLTAKSLALNILIPRQFALASAPCTALTVGQSCTVAIAFTPLTNGDIPGSIVVQAAPSDGTAPLVSIAYAEGFGTGSGSLALTGGLIVNGLYSFGQVTSGQTATQIFTLTDKNAAPLTIRRITSGPPFLASTTCGTTLTTHQSCAVTVTYTPHNQVATGTASPRSIPDAGTLTIESDAASSPDLLNLAGQAGPVSTDNPSAANTLATYTLSQGSLTFPPTALGNVSPSQTIVLTNTGSVTLHLLSLNAPADFTAVSNCTAILPGATCQFTVTSTPQTSGPHLASLEIATDAATTLEFVSLVSSATPSQLTLSPAALDFGAALISSSATLPVQVTNTGTTPLLFQAIVVTGDYTAAGTCPASGATLAPSAACTLNVTFKPTATGSRPGLLSVATSASTLPLTVALTGIGTQSKLVVTPMNLTFGTQPIGSPASQNLTLTNTGTSDITNLVLTTTGDFAITTNCAATLAAGATCTPQITFTPKATGTRNGTLSITSSDPGSPFAIPLTGMGTAAGSFTLTVDGGATSTVTVRSGAPASYHLALTPANGFNGPVVLTCTAVSPAPYGSCSLTPAALTLATGTQTAIATINTITSANGNGFLQEPFTRQTVFLCLLLPGIFALAATRRRTALPRLLAALSLMVLLAIGGCGSSSRNTDVNARYTPAGTYQYQVTATSTTGPVVAQTVTLNLTVTPR